MTSDDIYTDIEHSLVIDKNGLDIGTIEDFTFEDFKLKKFVVKGENPVVQEWLGVDGIYSLLLPHEHIRRQKGNEVHISVQTTDLEPIQEIGKNEQRFVIMKQIDVIALDGEDLGRIVDGIFHKDQHFSLILAGSKLNQILSKFGFSSSNNLFIPYRFVERFDPNIIQLKKNKEDLKTVINEILMDTDSLKLMDQQKLTSQDARMELYNESLKDVIRSNYNTSR